MGSEAIAAPSPSPAPPRESGLSPAPNSIEAAELDRAIDHVLSSPEFSWRMPRARVKTAEEPGGFRGFVHAAFDMVAGWMKAAARVGRRVFEFLWEKLFNKMRSPLPAADGGTGWMTSLQFLLYGLIAVVAAGLAIMALRLWRRRSRTEEVLARALPAAPDLRDENVLADQMPEESWLKLGRELMDRGELRLAVRAFYLATLAHLGQRELIRIARFKSNREYELELRRRARRQPEVIDAFAETIRLFDRVWYGVHEVTAADLSTYQNHHRTLSASGGPLR